ncbi:hypothetical protein OQI89_10165 [Lentilactobacillus diolivorans]|uniref:hypothetical protein n=1 Tax=Lentilactobacillus diolivorans TaxID=179838 RepID=UPI002468AE66|nr:hypothetical protein [Lentilactobacillus diolivorans]MDH5106215.1 hypothetical protein [Lentilactobacillus diolivorans]
MVIKKKHFKTLFVTLILTGTLLGIIAANPVQAKYTGHFTTPTEVRGNWYQYEGHHKWEHLKITRHAVSINGKVLYTPRRNGVHQLYITKYKKGYGGVNYTFNHHIKYHYQSLGSFWLSQRKIHGKRVLENYYNMSWFSVYTRNKSTHDYSYQYKGNYLKKIGR